MDKQTPNYDEVAAKRGYSHFSSPEKSIAKTSFIEGCDYVHDTEVTALQAEVERLKAEYNALGVKFDKETERWQERDAEETEIRRSLQSLNSELVEALRDIMTLSTTRNNEDEIHFTARALVAKMEAAALSHGEDTGLRNPKTKNKP